LLCTTLFVVINSSCGVLTLRQRVRLSVLERNDGDGTAEGATPLKGVKLDNLETDKYEGPPPPPRKNKFDKYPNDVHDRYTSAFNRNLKKVNGKEGDRMEKVLQGFTGTMNQAFLKPVFVNQTEHELMVKATMPTVEDPVPKSPIAYISDVQQPSDQMAEEDKERIAKLQANAKKETERLQKEKFKPAPQIPFPLPDSFKGPGLKDPPPQPMIGGRYGPASGLPVGTEKLEAPPAVVGEQPKGPDGTTGGGDAPPAGGDDKKDGGDNTPDAGKDKA